VKRAGYTLGWLLTTLLVIAGVGVLIRLGFWQLDRLDQRRAFNARVLAQTAAPQLQLGPDTLGLDLGSMEYRAVFVTGEYLHEQEVGLRNQSLYGQPGYRILTPLLIAGTKTAVLVDRGFVPSASAEPGEWELFAEPGTVQVEGIIRASQAAPDFGGRTDPTPLPGEALLLWHLANIPLIARQMNVPLLPIYIQQKPEGATPEGGNAPGVPDPFEGITHPIRTQPALELTEGPHLGYAIQWFIFAAILGIGYPFFVIKEIRKEKHG